MSYHRQKTGKLWALAGIGLLMVAIGAFAAHAAIEGPKRSAAPRWIGLFGVAIRPDGAIFAVGGKGTLLVSTDQGKTWTEMAVRMREGGPLFQDYDLYSIRFAPGAKIGYIVGENGTVLRSGDGGETWKAVATGTDKSLLKVFPIDEQQAVAVGADGAIVRTTDAGEHWQIEKSPINVILFDVVFLDKDSGWAVGEFASVLKTTDGGQTWKLASGGNTSDFTVGPYFTINFPDPQHGIVSGLAGELATSDDGGKSWKPTKLPDEVGTFAVAVDPNTKKIWAVGAGGRTFVQQAGGQWQEAARTTFNDLTDIALAGNRAVMVGLNGTILLSNDAGEKWQAVQ